MPKKTKDIVESEKKKQEIKVASKKTIAKKEKKESVKSPKKPNISNKTEKNKKSSTTSKKVTSSRKTSSSISSSAKKTNAKKKIEVLEYYDLPYRYNQTVVRILAQTPDTLFVYWDISDKDRQNYQKQYGENFFEVTTPVLVVYNDSMHYQFEVQINDFANSWYLQVNDSKCDYRIELGRRPISQMDTIIDQDYIYISTSNNLEIPNDKLLFENLKKTISFRNIKTNQEKVKSFSDFSSSRTIYDIYESIYQDEIIEDFNPLTNPSSHYFSPRS